MSNIDLSKIKPGDTVTVRTVVVDRNHDGKAAAISAGTPTEQAHVFWVEVPGEIVSHEPKALSVGDRVKIKSGRLSSDPPDEREWDVLHIDDSSFVLVGVGRHTRSIRTREELERVS